MQPLVLVCMDFLSLEGSREDMKISLWSPTTSHAMHNRVQPVTNCHGGCKGPIWQLHHALWVPTQQHSVQSHNFQSGVIKAPCKVAGIKKARTTPYHPMGIGMCERFNLLNMLGTPPLIRKLTGRVMSHHWCILTMPPAWQHLMLPILPGSRLPMDVAMRVPNEKGEEGSGRDYAVKPRDRLQWAHEIAGAILTRPLADTKVYRIRLLTTTLLLQASRAWACSQADFELLCHYSCVPFLIPTFPPLLSERFPFHRSFWG